MKKFLLLSLLLFQLISVSAQTTFIQSGIKYQVATSSTVSVVQNSPIYSGDIVIPETVTNSGTSYNVTSIAATAFFGCS